MRLSDRTSGLAILALGALAAYGGSRLPPVPGQQVGPNVFPMVVGIGLVLCGAMVAFGIGHSFEAEPVTEAGDGGEAAEPPPRNALWVLLPPALLLFYAFASETLGFILTAGLVALATALGLGARLRLALTVALLAPVAVHLVFAKLLRVPLPIGFVPMPW
ncbi:MAG: tripartite tricarboxylate transporter TctB family protein [Variibacter sp.]|nr:tripartite tricarboxylate transporter TctB family protein [Variibacter sp.]